jgi:site-specific recombinase XerD
MLDDMKLRNMALSTRKIYVAAVAGFSAYHGRSPDQLTLEDVRDYQLHLVARGLKASSICPIMSALRFFYGTTLGDREAAAEIPLPRKADPLPAILSQDEVKRLLTAVPDRKMRTLLTTVYAAGLRVSEVVYRSTVLRHRASLTRPSASGRSDRLGRARVSCSRAAR